MTSFFACAMCASPAAMSCGGCSGFTYCGVGCLSLHWREFGHDTQCGRIKPDVDARDAIRVAHDVQKLAWWQAAVVDTDEGRATACDALGSCHGKGVFRRECGCFRDVLFGTLPLDTLDASEFGVDTVDTAWFELGESNTLDRGVVSNAMSQYPTTWLELYETLGLPTTSRAALVLSTGATVLYAANVLGVLSGGQGVVSHGNGGEEGGGTVRDVYAQTAHTVRTVQTVTGHTNTRQTATKKQPFVVHVIGAEKELDQAFALWWFFRNTVAKSGRNVRVHLFGPEVPEGWEFFQEKETRLLSRDTNARPVEDEQDRGSTLRGGGVVSINAHKGLWHDVLESKQVGLQTPDFILCPDAGIAVFASWNRTIAKICQLNVPAYVTDLTAEAARMGAAIWKRRAATATAAVTNKYGEKTFAGRVTEVELNPFRQIMSARLNDTQQPTYRNGFGFAWMPGGLASGEIE